MTRVDFYIISDTNPQSEDIIACRLAEKALNQGYKILILGHNNKQLQALDEKLWTFSDQSFLPHEIINDKLTNNDMNLKLVLSDDDQANPQANLLINLSGKIPEHTKTFERVAEIVPARDQDRQQSRARFKAYREMNCELQTHNL